MASFVEYQDRRVIPNWRDFTRTAILGELNDNTFNLDSRFNIDYIKKYIGDWHHSKTIGNAANLLNAAFIADYYDDSTSCAAGFILNNQTFGSPELIRLASHFNHTAISQNKQILLEQDDFDGFQLFFAKNNIWDKIHFYKQKVHKEPRNAIAWVELSRFYSLLGEKEKAIKSMEIARILSPDNRFVIRSYSRLLIHYREFDLARYVLHKNGILERDPWVLSVEISLALILQKRSKYFKKGLDLLEDNKLRPLEVTELASALATVHFYDENLNKSRKLFNLSLIGPNDNTLAQAEWIKTKHLNIRIPDRSANISNAFEALALEKFGEGKWMESFQLTRKWLMDLPYSNRPVSMGSYIATVILKDFNTAELLCNIGLQANPLSPEIINNYCYLLALQNRIDEAHNMYNRIYYIPENFINEREKIVLKATAGLIYFRRGLIEIGRESYEQVLKKCLTIKDTYLYNQGLLNYLREEILIKSEKAPELMRKAEKELKNERNGDILFIKNEIFELYNKYYEIYTR